MNTKGCHAVNGTGRVKSAAGRNQRREKPFVELQEKDCRDCGESGSSLRIKSPARVNECTKEFFTAGIFFFRMALRGIRIRLQGNNASAPILLRDSLSSRLARFRFTALVSNFLLHMIPQRQISSVSATHKTVNRPSDSRRPICFTLSNSLRQRRLTNVFTGAVLPGIPASESQSLTAFGAAAFQNQTASAGLHSLSESAGAETFDLRRLIRSLHFYTFLCVRLT